MSSGSTRRDVSLLNEKTCLLGQQEEMSSSSTRRLLLVGQEDMSSCWTRKHVCSTISNFIRANTCIRANSILASHFYPGKNIYPGRDSLPGSGYYPSARANISKSTIQQKHMYRIDKYAFENKSCSYFGQPANLDWNRKKQVTTSMNYCAKTHKIK